MSWLAALGVAAIGVGGTVPLAAAAGPSKPAVSVRPAVGSPHTRFVVTFRVVPGRVSSRTLVGHYEVTASGPRGTGCVSAAAGAAYGVEIGRLATVRLSARRGFCRGTFRGKVTIILTPVCSGPPTMARPTIVCPMFVIDGGIVGRFTFKVK